MRVSTFGAGAQRATGMLFIGLIVVGSALVANGCQSSVEEPDGSGGTMGLGGQGSDDAASCEDLSEEHEALLNAPTDAVVVRKKPNIPQAP